MEKYHTKLKISELKKWEKNPKKHRDDLIEKSISEFGYIDDIVVDENNRILSGHGRLEALKKLGYKEVDVIRVTGLTEEQKEKYALLVNKSVEAGGWDLELLEEFDEDLLSDAGFEDSEIDEIFSDMDVIPYSDSELSPYGIPVSKSQNIVQVGHIIESVNRKQEIFDYVINEKTTS